jgi:hypothetical protein
MDPQTQESEMFILKKEALIYSSSIIGVYDYRSNRGFDSRLGRCDFPVHHNQDDCGDDATIYLVQGWQTIRTGGERGTD